MAPKRLFSPEEPSTTSSPSNEQDNEPQFSTIPPFPSLSSDSESDSEHRWIIKPNKPRPNAKRAKKNKFIAAEEEQANTTMNASTISCEMTSLREKKISEGASKSNLNHLQVVELEFAIYIKCVQIVAAQAKLIYDAYNSSKNH